MKVKVTQNNIHEVIGNLKEKLIDYDLESKVFKNGVIFSEGEELDEKKSFVEMLEDLGLIKTAKFIKRIFK